MSKKKVQKKAHHQKKNVESITSEVKDSTDYNNVDYYAQAVAKSDAKEEKSQELIKNEMLYIGREKTNTSLLQESIEEESSYSYSSSLQKLTYEEKDRQQKLLFGSKFENKQKFIAQLQKISTQALEDGSLTHALKAQEMIGKAEGYFDASKSSGKNSKCALTLNECSDEDIDSLIDELRLANAGQIKSKAS